MTLAPARPRVRRLAGRRPPGVVTVGRSVLWLTLRVWFNDLARTLGSRARAAAAVATGLGLMMAAAAWSGVLARDSVAGVDILDPGAATTVAALVVTIPAITTVMAHMYAPPRTLVLEMLTVMPVSRTVTRLAVGLLTCVLGLVLGVLLLAPLAGPVLDAVVAAPTSALGLLVLGLTGPVLALALIGTVTVLLTRVARAGDIVAQGLAGLAAAVALGAGLVAALPVNHHEPGGLHLVTSGPFLRWSAGVGSVVEALPHVGLVAAGTLVAWLAARHDISGREGARSVRPVWPSQTIVASLWRLELAQVLRYPSNVVVLVLLNGLGLLGLAWSALGGQDGLGLGALLLMALSCWGIGAFGPTAGHHWIHRTAGRPNAWVWPKLGAVLTVWLAMIAVHGTWLVLLTDWMLIDLLVMLPVLFVEVVVSCTIGIVLPVSLNNSMAGAFSEGVALMVLVTLTGAVQSVTGALPDLLSMAGFHGALVVGALLVYRTVARAASAADRA